METNLRGSMLCAQAVLPHMIERGAGIVINMSGGGAAGPMIGGSGYGSSKAALLRLTDSLAARTGARSVRPCLSTPWTPASIPQT